MNRRTLTVGMTVVVAAIVGVYVFSKYGPAPSLHAAETAAKSGGQPIRNDSLGLDYFSKRPIGKPPEGVPWITDLLIVDLDQDGLKDILVCDGQLNKVSWIRQVRLGVFEEQDIGDTIAGPVHVEVADLNGDGHLDVLVASMGVIPPNNVKTGAVVALVNDGLNHFTNRVLLENVSRVTYVAAADLNQDGRLDLVVGEFGYIEGEVRWMENLGDCSLKVISCWICRARFTRRWSTLTVVESWISSLSSHKIQRKCMPLWATVMATFVIGSFMARPTRITGAVDSALGM